MAGRYTIGDAARGDQVIEVTCRRCHRSTLFLAADLVDRVPMLRDISNIPFKCARCNDHDVHIRPRSLDDRDRNKVLVMRPVGTKTVTVWKEVRL
jgi:hypothetical protein